MFTRLAKPILFPLTGHSLLLITATNYYLRIYEMDHSNKQVTTFSLVSGLMILTVIIINRVGYGVYFELIQGLILGLSVVISFVALHKFAMNSKAIK